MNGKLFSELGLSPELLKAIAKLGFEQASPIQAESIPLLLTGKDIVGQSQTGSGKTAAFAAPAIEKVDATKRVTQVLVLAPTRELAVQVSEEVHKLAFFKPGIRALPIYGGQSYERQFFGLKQGAHIVIGTPGRVMDHMRRGTLRLDGVKMVVLDEADVMLNMGFREDIEFILQAVPQQRQTVFFSATMPRPIRELIEKYAREPQTVKIEQKAMTVPTVEQVYYEVDRRFKMELLTRLIDLHDYKLGIIFCNTKRMVDDLVDHLEAAGYQADRLHGDMTQHMRDRVMNKFRKSGLEFLVATDIAARGIDVDDVEVVFNYDLPYDGEDYVHRIGRTGRAGRSGRAISFASGRELFQIRHIERFTNIRIHRARIPTENEVVEARESVFLEKLRAMLQSGDFKKQDHLVERLLEEGFTSTDIASACLAQLQSGETAAKPAARTEEYTRPEDRAPRGEFRDGPRERFAERRAPRYEKREDSGRPQKFAPRREELPPAGAPVSKPAHGPSPSRPEKEVGTPPPPPLARPHVESGAPAALPSAPAPVETVPLPAESAAEPAVPAPVLTETAPAVPAKPKKLPVSRPVRSFAEGKFEERKLPARKFADRQFDERPPRFAGRRESAAPWFERKGGPKASRRTPAAQTRLWMNVGAEMGVGPGDVVGAILGETGLPSGTVGTVDIRDRHLFVDVASESANAIVSKLNRTRIKGNRIKAKVA